MEDDFLIISVESRKGGVGKTTAALNMARILLEKRHRAVLFVDADITGTNATDSLDSPFWKDICHPIRCFEKGKIRVANLLAIFERQFMPGLSIPRFVKESQKKVLDDDHLLDLALDKINVLGSQIYDSDPRSKATGICISKPSVLFDELHAFWFIQFLEEICQAFWETVRKYQPDHAVAVVVDNSPGYIGIAPAVQEWLTDLGPALGKFLTVSSLDKQDLISCGHAVHNLHQLYAHKWQVSQQFRNAIGSERDTTEEYHLARDEEGFFLRLLEAPPMTVEPGHAIESASFVSGADLAFYQGANAEAGRMYFDQPDRYQGLILNRVPRLIRRGVYSFDTELILSLQSQGNKVVQRLLGKDKTEYAQRMVSYDEYIEFQFLQSLISPHLDRRSRRSRRLRELMNVLEGHQSLPPDEALQKALQAGDFSLDPETLYGIYHYIDRLHESLIGAIRLVEQYGFSDLTRLIQDDWLPGNIFRGFRNAIQGAILDTGFPFEEIGLEEIGEDHVSPETWKFIQRLRSREQRYIVAEKAGASGDVMEQFLPSLTVVAAFSVNYRWFRSRLDEDILSLLWGIAAVEALHWQRLNERPRKRRGIQQFLAVDSLTEKELRDYGRKLWSHPRWLEKGDVGSLYRECASAQARLIDVRRDAEFLIALIHRLVVQDFKESPILPYIQGVAEKVIVRKTLSHGSGRREIAGGFSSVQYMEEFFEVLERILMQWEGRQ